MRLLFPEYALAVHLRRFHLQNGSAGETDTILCRQTWRQWKLYEIREDSFGAVIRCALRKLYQAKGVGHQWETARDLSEFLVLFISWSRILIVTV